MPNTGSFFKWFLCSTWLRSVFNTLTSRQKGWVELPHEITKDKYCRLQLSSVTWRVRDEKDTSPGCELSWAPEWSLWREFLPSAAAASCHCCCRSNKWSGQTIPWQEQQQAEFPEQVRLLLLSVPISFGTQGPPFSWLFQAQTLLVMPLLWQNTH